MILIITTKSLKRKNKGGDYYRRKTKNLHKVIVDYMKMKGQGKRQEELKLHLAFHFHVINYYLVKVFSFSSIIISSFVFSL